MADLEQKTVELLDKLDAIATQYTPEVIEGAIGSIQITAIGNLIWGLIGVGATYACWWITKNMTSFCRTKKDEGGWTNDWEIGATICFIFGGIISIILFMNGIAELFDIWNWTAIFNPKLALIHKTLGL